MDGVRGFGDFRFRNSISVIAFDMLISYPIVQPNKSITFKSVLLLILSIKVGSEYRYLDHHMRYKNIFVRFSGHDSFVTDGVLGMKLLNVIMTFVTKVICRIYVACYCQ